MILYDTMWEGTRRMAEAIGDGLAAEGVPCKLFHMAVSDRNDVVTEIFKAKAIVVGSPTFNQGLLPIIMPILEDLKGLKFRNKVGATFGSYGGERRSSKVNRGAPRPLQNSVGRRGRPRQVAAKGRRPCQMQGTRA